MSWELSERVSMRTFARICGGLYVLYRLASVLANALGHIGLGSVQEVYDAIATDPSTGPPGYSASRHRGEPPR